MTRSIREIEQEVRSLPASEKIHLLRDLIADLNGEPDIAAEEAWLEEAKRRFSELQDGSVEPTSAADVIRRARSRLKDEG